MLVHGPVHGMQGLWKSNSLTKRKAHPQGMDFIKEPHAPRDLMSPDYFFIFGFENRPGDEIFSIRRWLMSSCTCCDEKPPEVAPAMP